MSEQKMGYVSAIPQTVEAFKNRFCALDLNDPDFRRPSPSEIKALRELVGFTQVEMAQFVGVAWSPKKGSNTIRKWETDEESKEHRPITLSAWKLMLIKAGLISIDVMDNNR